MQPRKEPGIENEPHLQPLQPPAQPAYGPTVPGHPPGDPHPPGNPASEPIDVLAERTVWDEPAIGDLAGPCDEYALTYARWLSERISTWSQWQAWQVTLGVSLLAGPWALLISLLYVFQGKSFYGDLFVYCGVLPLVQEIAKIAILLWIVEKRPYYFTGWFQLFFCTMASCVIFVTVMNSAEFLFYWIAGLIDPKFQFDVRIDFIIAWTAFFGMHLITSFLASLGLEKVWRGSIVTLKPPKLEAGYVWFMSAYLIHVVYAVGYMIFTQIRSIAL